MPRKKSIQKTKREEKESYHWADGIVEQLVKQASKAKHFTCAAGIAPSGTVHIGHFREIITVDLVARALKEKGKKVRFIYSWDDFDRFRKVPGNMPRQNLLKDYLGLPISAVPDPHDCHKSYAEHFEKEFEAEAPKLGIKPEFICQSKEYQSCNYAKEIRFVLENKEKFRNILNRHRKEPLPDSWWPVQVYCERCMKDTTRILEWDNNFTIEYECECNHHAKVDFSKKGMVKLPWRIDWPMRWHHEQVDFEPGGKEHSTPGGSRDTAKKIIEEIYKEKAPLYMMYDYIIIKGVGGKMSSSLGNVITARECLEIYEPQILRYLFASTRPNTEFSITFDQDVIKIYAEYDKLEDEYFKKKLDKKQQRIYELSQTESGKPKKIFAPAFRQLVEMVQLKSEKEILDFYKQGIKAKADRERTLARIKLARNWLKYAPEQFKFKLKEELNEDILNKLSKPCRDALKELAQKLHKLRTEEEIMKEIRETSSRKGIKPLEFFRSAYLVLLGKESGPRFGSLILLEKDKISKMLQKI